MTFETTCSASGSRQAVVFASMLFSGAAQAITLAEFDLQPASGTSLAPAFVATDVTSSNLTVVNSANTASAFGNHFYHNGWDSVLNPAKYYQVTLSSAAFLPTSTSFSMEEDSFLAGGWTLRSSADGFTSDLGTGVFAGGEVTNFIGVDLTSIGTVNGDLTLRWYVTADDPSTLAGFANHEPGGPGAGFPDVGIDLTISGDVLPAPIPEPSSIILAGLGGFGLLSRRRKSSE